jgi:hypothetical protein
MTIPNETPTPRTDAEFDFVKLLKQADELVRGFPLYRKFIDGTPLENDIAVWLTQFFMRGRDFSRQLECELAEAKESKERSRQWWASREGRISQWIRDNKERLPEWIVNEWFAIWANGTKDVFEPPRYASQLNEATRQLAKARASIDLLKEENAKLQDCLNDIYHTTSVTTGQMNLIEEALEENWK